ncbi:non-heme iron oxygenase ferredoxin subunit [Variovorax guangxiensis]|uniref:Non-heme iron oxygenase ferredoxin subunit n=1 Tax=Variovorax guangxiensis TaxID=1775474 RepID=A0A502DLC9_9BURK|nr:non-heme iron oxygenase ferredoxin subunit [Variovorax guangxiensis]TPG22165.1 non-heme iron oxygenase ferredoxin subunit [Variovorax ginsengisoli]TPG26053.1 non-heme iron oxygenase ferredoxin subunit [Variovorax guangxiensis]
MQTENELLTLCSAAEAADFGALRVEPEGLPPLAVFFDDGEYFVTDDTCSHGEASLSEGMVEGGKVECPWHSGKFCLRTGAAESFPAETPVRVYPAILRDGHVCIRRPE